MSSVETVMYISRAGSWKIKKINYTYIVTKLLFFPGKLRELKLCQYDAGLLWKLGTSGKSSPRGRCNQGWHRTVITFTEAPSYRQMVRVTATTHTPHMYINTTSTEINIHSESTNFFMISCSYPAVLLRRAPFWREATDESLKWQIWFSSAAPCISGIFVSPHGESFTDVSNTPPTVSLENQWRSGLCSNEHWWTAFLPSPSISPAITALLHMQ